MVTIGSCVRDIIFYTDQAEFLKNPKDDPTKLYLLGFEYGAKIKSNEITYSFGGGASNTAVNFAGLKLKTGIISCLGKNGFGSEIEKRLKSKKVDVSLMKRSALMPTGISFLVVDKKTNEHFLLVSYGANDELKVSQEDLKKFATDWFYVSSLSSASWLRIMESVVGQKKKIAWNPGSMQLKAGYHKIKKYLKATDVLLLNKDEAIELCLSAGIRMKNWSAKKLAEIIWDWGIDLSCVTEGQKGAWIYDGQKYYFGKPNHGKPKDTTGAGDCFGSTFVAGLIKTKGDINTAMKLALANTASLVFKPGAQEGLLSWEQLKKKI